MASRYSLRVFPKNRLRGGCGAWLLLKALKASGEGPYKWWFVLLPTNVRHHNPSPFGTSILASTLSFLRSMWDRPQIHPPLGYNPSPFGTSILASTLSFLQSTWDRPQIHSPLGPSVLTGTPPRVYSPSGNSEKVDTLSGVLTLIPFVTTQIHR